MSGQSATPRENAGNDLATGTAVCRLAAAFVELALAERERWALWIPALLGCGIGFYFMLTVEPPGWSGPAAFVGVGRLLPLVRKRAGQLLISMAGEIVASGFADAP